MEELPVGVVDVEVEEELVDDVDDELDGEAGKVSEALDEARLQNWRASDSALESSSEHCAETQPTRSRGKTPLLAIRKISLVAAFAQHSK